MKTHTIKTPIAELLVVELPEDSTLIEIFGLIGADENNSPDYHLTLYKFSDYTLLGKPDEIKEEDARELVKAFEFGTEKYPHLRFFIHKTDYSDWFTATESLLSLIESEIDEQFDFKRTLIFIKNEKM